MKKILTFFIVLSYCGILCALPKHKLHDEYTTLGWAICIVRNNTSSLPTFNAPDVGDGYQKINIPFKITYVQAIAYCNKYEIYPTLEFDYCKAHSESIQKEVALFTAKDDINSLLYYGCPGDLSACVAYHCS